MVRSLGRSGRFREVTMLKDRLERPCSKCGMVVHFDGEEYRLNIPCPTCGAQVAVPHGRTLSEHAVSMDPSCDLSKPDHSMGWMTIDEMNAVFERNAIGSIRRWEEAVRSQSPPDACRKARDEAFQAICNLGIGKKWFNFNGNRHTLVRKSRDIQVAPIPPKRTGKRDG
jgi:endogenous inhibitor of DNA gyrase (YacG/DUF329 family)